MQNAVIHLKTTESFLEKLNKEKSDSIINAFMEACSKLDARIFEPFMEEDANFEDKDKYQFLTSMKKNFSYYKKRVGESFFTDVDDDVCNGCQFGLPIKRFFFYQNEEIAKSDEDRHHFIDGFAYVIQKENGILKDIFICNGIVFAFLKPPPFGINFPNTFSELSDDVPF